MSAATPVYVFGENRAPVYHRAGELVTVKDTATQRVQEMRTSCGRAIWTAVTPKPGSPNYDDHAVRLRHDWAEKIGRPCANCERAR